MPTTEAGKRLLENGDAYTYTRAVLADQIDAIEAEALSKADMASAYKVGYDTGRYDERARIRAAVEARLRIVDNPGSIDSLRAVLRIIDRGDIQ